jgi:hypothetical protein
MTDSPNVYEFQYHYKRYMAPYQADFDTIEGAIGMALHDLNSGDAWPVKITSNGQTLWEHSNLDIEEFAATHGIHCPE